MKLTEEVTHQRIQIVSKDETIQNLHAELNKYKGDLDKLNNDILMKLTLLMNKPVGDSQSQQELNHLIGSMKKLDHEILQLKANNREIISKNDNNFYILKDQLDKATNEMKNSKRVEHVTKTIIQAPPKPVTERIVRAAPIRRSVIRERSPIVRRYREMPTSSQIEYSNHCTCHCSQRQVHTHSNEFNVEKCPICNIGFVNTRQNGSVSKRNQRVSNVTSSQINNNKSYVKTNKNRVYQRRMSTEPLKNSVFSNKYFIDNVSEVKETHLISRPSERLSVEPLHKRISHRIRHNPIKSYVERDPYLIHETVKQSENVKSGEIRKSVSRRYSLKNIILKKEYRLIIRQGKPVIKIRKSKSPVKRIRVGEYQSSSQTRRIQPNGFESFGLGN